MAGRNDARRVDERFVELKCNDRAVLDVVAAARCFEVVLGGGVVVRVPEGFDAVSLDELLDVLEKHRC